MWREIMIKKSTKRCLEVIILILGLLFSSTYVYATQSHTENFDKTYSLGVNQAENLVNVAQKQIGKSKANLGYTEAWCADFVCDCAKLTGMPESIIPYNYGARGACTSLYNYMIKNCSAKVVSSREQGDIIFYYCSGCNRYVHVGIVVDGTYSIEGNYDGKVTRVKHSYTDSAGHTLASGKITRAYLRPNYSNSGNSTPVAPSGNNPFGQLESIESTYDGVAISGWAIDMDAPQSPVEIHIYVGGAANSGCAKNVFKLSADLPRGDVSQKYPEAGENHGYYGVLDITGTETLYIYLCNIGSGENVLLSTPTVEGKNYNPIGSIDLIETRYNGVRISGWAIDRDAPQDPVEIHVYVGGAADSGQAKNVFKLSANLKRDDIAEKYQGVGSYHGYDGVLDITGTEVIYIYLYNIGKGQNVLLGAPTVEGKSHNPFGNLESVKSTYEGVEIGGWGVDMDAPNESIEVHVYVGGAAGSGEAKNVFKLSADLSRNDVSEKYPGVGENHGFYGLLDITGTEIIYVYLYNIGLGESTLIGTPTVTGKSSNPVGSIDDITSTCEGVRISGWAIDGDALTEPLDVHIYVGGAANSGHAKNVYQIKADIYREDLEKKFSIAGGKHGYNALLDIPGTEDIYIYLINKGSGENTLLGISTVGNKEHAVADGILNQKDATCLEEGYTGDTYCKNCGKILSFGKKTSKVDHKWDEGKITQEATSSKPGIRTYVCTVCNATKTEEIPATGENDNIPELSVSQKGGKLVAILSNIERVTGYGFVYGKDSEVTLDTPGRIRVVFTELNEESSFTYAMSGLTEYTYRAYVIYTDENGDEKIKYSEPVV